MEIQQTTDQTVDHADLIQFFKVGNSGTFVVDGPLGVQYSQALDVLYKKEIDPVTGIVLESQANDAIAAKQIWLALMKKDIPETARSQELGMMYGVSRNAITHQDSMNFIDAISRMSPIQKTASSLILDADTGCAGSTDGIEEAGAYEERVRRPITAALEAYCTEQGVAVYSSLAEFIKRSS